VATIEGVFGSFGYEVIAAAAHITGQNLLPMMSRRTVLF
jgi:hypothetical protein